METPKQKLIEIIFGPIINFLENKIQISGFFIPVFFIVLVSIPFFRVKSRSNNDIFRKIIIIIAIVLSLVLGIIDTVKIRVIS